MKFKKFRSSSIVNVSTKKYEIDWDRRVSKPQKKTKDALRNLWASDYVLEEFPIPGSKKRIDLLNWTKKIVIEVSPSGSHEYNDFFHKSRSSFCRLLRVDQEKRTWAFDNNFSYLVLGDEELSNLTEESISRLIEKAVSVETLKEDDESTIQDS